jgi:uncharacterized protein YceH (UPF0502 family)
VLAVLLLRGAQTPGELKQRTERMQGFPDLPAVQDTLDRLIERDLVHRLARRPGQKEERHLHRMSEEAEGAAPVAEAPEPLVAAPPRPSGVNGRVEKLEAELAELRTEVSELREQLEALRTELGA